MNKDEFSLHRDGPIVKAAIAMVYAHKRHETSLPAIEEVHAQFPDIDFKHLILLWAGVNAKNREGLD